MIAYEPLISFAMIKPHIAFERNLQESDADSTDGLETESSCSEKEKQQKTASIHDYDEAKKNVLKLPF